jgi:hypothetical protein
VSRRFPAFSQPAVTEFAPGDGSLADMTTVTVLHVARAFSAQPTLGELLGEAVRVVELPQAEALAPSDLHADLVWISTATADDVRAVRRRFPSARVLATPRRSATSEERVDLISEADLVLLDEGVVLAAAGLGALSRRLVEMA